ncbi:hypothetical protein [Aliivibrio salmonicida]|uniref:hypothetical protein n=1 Tax=Aliivibrio salmonicida TaxID=40269 RepID=UPI0030AD4F5C
MGLGSDERKKIQVLGELITFTSKVAMTIRMNSSYNQRPNQEALMSLNVMWLSDMLHNLWKLGGALQSSDTSEVIAAIEYMEAYWKAHIEEVESARKNSKIDEWTLEDGFDILRRLRGLYCRGA